MRSLPILILAFSLAAAARVQASPAGQAHVETRDRMFSGIVTAMAQNSLTVSQWVLGKETAVKTFTLTPETRIEGKPRVKARVTVRYVQDENGERAIHIIVRPSGKK